MGGAGAFLRRLSGRWQHHGKACADALAGEHLEMPAVAFHNPFGNGKPQPRAAGVKHVGKHIAYDHPTGNYRQIKAGCTRWKHRLPTAPQG